MEADETSAARTSPSSSLLCLSSETNSSGELTGPFPDGLCPRCEALKIRGNHLAIGSSGGSIWTDYPLEDSLPGLPVLSRSARHGCKFCELLKSIIVEHVSHEQRHQWLKNTLLSTHYLSYTFSHGASLSYLKVPVDFKKLPHLEETVQYDIHFEVESAEGESGSWLNITRRLLEPHPLSKNNVAKFKSWLHQCHAGHEDCQHNRITKNLPTRLLAVGGEPLNESPRLIVCSEHPALTDYEETPYIALSHCWGKEIPPMKTERHSLPDRLECIPLETMPRTYHDAVLLTRSLGISYLWIDSLCIVQDDKDDWKRESSSMAEVYQNAYLTVCALVTSCNDGLFRGSRERGFRIPFNSQITEERGDYLLRHAATISSYEQDVFLTDYETIRHQDSILGSSWLSRGWTFQEELFSTRRLMCSERMIYLDCNMASCSENSMLGEAVSKSLPSRLRNSHRAFLFSHWYKLVSSYSRRSLTYEQDRLPAISSLAASFAEQTEDNYIAGLWKNDLPHGLLWYRADDQENRPNLSDLVKRLTCRSQFIAPSWSWACESRFTEWPRGNEHDSVQCKVLKAWSETDDINPFGSITSADLVMEDGFDAKTSGSSLGDWRLDFDPAKDDVVDWMEDSETNRAIMFILTKEVHSAPNGSFESLRGLLLHPTACPNEYLRIGVFYVVRGSDKTGHFLPSLLHDFLEDAPCRKIRLI